MAATERPDTVALNDDTEVSLGSLESGMTVSTLLVIRGVSTGDVSLLIRKRTDPGPTYTEVAKRPLVAGFDFEIGVPVHAINDAADSLVATLGSGESGTFDLQLTWLDRS